MTVVPNTTPEPPQKFTQMIKKHLTVFGPDITFAQLQQIQGLQVDAEGNVTNMSGDQTKIQQSVIAMWMQLSPFLAKQIT